MTPWHCGECGHKWEEDFSLLDQFMFGGPPPRCPDCSGLDVEEDPDPDTEEVNPCEAT